VSSRYFFVELLTGAIWAGIWYQYMVAGQDWTKAIAYALAASALVAIIFIDWELYIIPDQINAFLAFVGIGYNVYLYSIHSASAVTWGMPSALAGGLTGVGVLWGIAFLGRVVFRKDAMGHGDIKMARGTGAVLFPVVACISFGLAVVLGAVLGIVQILIRKEPPTVSGSVEGEEKATSNLQAVEETEEDYQPESIGSLLFCGLGYVLCIDIIGLFIPKLYMFWFKESPYITQEEWEDFHVENTMIPFGPYLALGAIVATIFASQLQAGVENYLKWASGRAGQPEHSRPTPGLLSGEGWSVRR
jgi:leader peptidase (prepilin peptidase)/N-methyltransferase